MAYSCFYQHDSLKSLKQPYSATLNDSVCWHVARSTRKLRSCCARNSLRRRPDLFATGNCSRETRNCKFLKLTAQPLKVLSVALPKCSFDFTVKICENHNSFLGFLTLSILKLRQMFVQHLNLLRALLLRCLQALPRVDTKQQHPNMS